ncbi:MAG: two-component response regulator [Candidatus Brocadia fulgida]|uniref:Two-component response regulator n=1 Tax=Candidatus Brocadia fulgida TaxID=380242 RepID=A0A0M2UZJ1_9BACT|nr:MAG: two-component response regulator [Candidatus Brocadia fulgida]
MKKGINVSACDINLEPLPYPDNSFDCITLIAVIEHLIDPYHSLKEITRVLKTGGTLIIGTPNVASFSNRIKLLLGKRPRTSFDAGWDGGHLLYFTPKELELLLTQHRFKIASRQATGNLQLLRKLFFNLTGEFIFQCVLEK